MPVFRQINGCAIPLGLRQFFTLCFIEMGGTYPIQQQQQRYCMLRDVVQMEGSGKKTFFISV